MNFCLTEGRLRLSLKRTLGLMLVLGLLFTACIGGVAEASASTDLLIVNKKTNKLAYFSGGKLEKTFPVATGKTKALTPEGSFKIVVKIQNRPYYKEKIPGGDPSNPLGDRWLGLEVNGTKGTTYAIHGNNNESSIGKYVSAGCIRMHNEDIRWLYPRISKNTTVVIISTSADMESIAVNHGYAVGKTLVPGTFIVGGVSTKLQEPFVVEQSRVYVPLKELVTLSGGTMNRNAGTGELTIAIGNRSVTHKPLSDKAVVNGTSVTMLPSRNVNDRLLIPLSSVPALFGINVKWNPQQQSVTLLK
ncbi:L,D-transpeptidase family protein [Paenibacillus agri]|nr:L,D-transpeptidase family protein [Paenibacillus agri]